MAIRHPILRSALVLTLALTGCGSCGSEDEVLRAAEIAREIRERPDDTEAILEEHEMTIEELEALMYEIAADPEKSQRYQEALGPAE
jgi:hypothetical protein